MFEGSWLGLVVGVVGWLGSRVGAGVGDVVGGFEGERGGGLMVDRGGRGVKMGGSD